MKVQFGIMMPKSLERKRTLDSENGALEADLDNLVKTVKDACSGIVFLDDNQVVKVVAEKNNALKAKHPLLECSFVS